MLPHNHLVAADFERQSRDRIQQAAEGSRKLRRNSIQDVDRQGKSVKKSFFGLGWLKDLRFNPAS